MSKRRKIDIISLGPKAPKTADELADGFKCKDPKCPCKGRRFTDLTIEERDQVRMFPSGASRDTEEGKLDYEGYLSPLVLKRYAEYMQKHQTRSDGSKRASDDWQQGIPKDVYAKSLLRHVMDFWLCHRKPGQYARETLAEALCAIIFNAMGYLYNLLEGKE